MPPVGAAIAAYVAEFSFTNFIIGLALNFALGFVKSKLFPTTSESMANVALKRTVILRSAVANHRIVYGRALLSGALVFGAVTDNKSLLHLVIALLGHEADAMDDVYINDKLSTDGKFGKLQKQENKWTATNAGDANIGLTINGITFTQAKIAGSNGGTDNTVASLRAQIIGAAGYATENYTVGSLLKTKITNNPFISPTVDFGTLVFTAKVAGAGFTLTSSAGTWDHQVIRANESTDLISLFPHLGTPDQAADSNLITATTPKWTSACRLRGVAYLYTKLKANQTAFPTGLPNIRVALRGRKIMDPRDTPVTVQGATAASPSVIQINSHGLSVGQSIFIKGTNNPDLYGELYITAVPDSNHVRGILHRRLGTVANNYEMALTSSATGGSAYNMRWSDNWALCVLDYHLAYFGLLCADDEIDWAAYIAAANISDEQVTLTVTSDVVTASPDTDQLRYTGPGTGARNGDIVRFTSTGTLPGSLAPATNYYFVDFGRDSNGKVVFSVATNLANARARIVINITSAGTGVHTLELRSQLRYTANGIIDTTQEPAEILDQMKTAGAGFVIYTQGHFTGQAGAYTASEHSFDADSLRDDLDVQTKLPRRDLYNVVKGTYINPDRFWQPTDFAPMKNAAYATADGEEIFTDLQLPFTDEEIHAQRLAKILLEKSRKQISVRMPCNLSAFKAAVGDVVDLTFPDLSWTAKEFRVHEWELSEDGGVDLLLQEE
jgi:hypothetical protein